jgi:hypothetical protein
MLRSAAVDYAELWNMTQEKEFGKLTSVQFSRLIRKLPEFRKESGALEEALRKAPAQNIRDLLGDGIWWAPFYELTLVEACALLLYVLDKVEWIKSIAAAPDPQEAALAELDNDTALEWNGGPGGVFSKSDLFALFVVLQKNILSIMLYKQSVCGLIEDARERGDDDALLKAIRIDRSVVSCPTAAARISRADVLGQQRFFLRLRSALKGPPRKHWEGYRDLRYSLFMLRELGLDSLSDDQLEHLLVKTLKVYPDRPSARKNLRKQYSESRKIKSL